MRRLKTIISIAGILLLILSAASMYVALKALSELRPAEDYEDQGVLTFRPYDVLPVQVQNTGASSRDRRMNPTKTVYMVYYLATDGSGYKWSDEALTRDLGKDIVEAGETVRRRVLSIPSDGTYITVEPEQTAGSYAESLRRRYTRIVGLSALYILFYFIVLILVKLVSQLRKDRAADTEMERFSAPVSSGPERCTPKKPVPRCRWGRVVLLALLPVVVLLFVFWAIGHQSSDSISVPPANTYLPPTNEEGYCVLAVPPSLMGNKTQEELLEEWQEDLKNVTPENRDQMLWEDLQANEDGSVSYFCTPEQYQRMKQLYYYQGRVNAARLLERLEHVKYTLMKPDPATRAQSTHVQFSGNKVYALDGHRLAWDVDDTLCVQQPFMVLPEALEYLKMFGDQEVAAGTGERYLRIADEKTVIQTRIEGPFVFNVDGAVPKEFSKEFYVFPKDFLRELDYLKKLAHNAGKVNVYFSNGRLSMIAAGGRYDTQVQIDGTSEIDFGFELRYMIDALRQFRGEPAVKMKVINSMAPIVLETEGRSDFAMVLPVRMNIAAA